MPQWGSFLWYYDWFILSALMGVTGYPGGAIAVIKGINYYTFTMPTGSPADITVSITAVDPSKAVVMLFGAGFDYWQDTVAVANYPYPKAMYSSSMILRASLYNRQAAECGALLIEYI
jgi:acyl dehydratase